MRITERRRTDLNDLELHQPERFRTAEADIKTDTHPLRFTSPIYTPLTPDRLVTVHPENSNKTGGFFGMTRSQGKQEHKGLDIEASNEKGMETGVMAAEDGVVSYAGWAKGYGNVIYVDHRGGYQTRYAHLSEIDVKTGQKVAQGELIGNSGKTGNADSPDILPHLHFEIRKNGEPLDPLPFITTPRPDRELFLMIEGLNGDIE
jgi:murein DD-endopeptidase MepM/ murein hydrolase activator NlpD